MSALSNQEATATFALPLFSLLSVFVNCNYKVLPSERLGLILTT